MNLTVQRLCAWSGLASIVLLAVGFWGVAGFLPPPSPADDAQEIAQLFEDDTYRIRAGMIISLFASILLAPWSAVITVQLRRIEGRHSVLSWTWIIVATCLVLEFLFLLMFWQTASYRPGRDPDSIYIINDLAWIPFVGLTSSIVMQAFVLGIAMLIDKRPTPIFPRWGGYFNLWAALCLTPGTFVVCFKDGPLAWDGLIALWIPVCVFATWMVVNAFLMARAVDQQTVEEPEPDLAAQVEELRAELDRIKARV